MSIIVNFCDAEFTINYNIYCYSSLFFLYGKKLQTLEYKTYVETL